MAAQSIERTGDLEREVVALRKQQRALSTVLRAIARSAGLQVVLDEIVEACRQLCEADHGALWLLRDGLLHSVSHDAGGDASRYDREHPHTVDRTTIAGRVAATRALVHVPDILEDAEYAYRGPRPFRAMLGAPVTMEDELLGVVVVVRVEQRPYTDEQIELLRTFADQAAIALANARLLEAVDRQRSALARFLPPQVAELVASEEGERLLAGHRAFITCVFCDLRGFTAFAETAAPEELLDVLRGYHETVGRLVTEHEGTLEHFAGDGLMVFFNDPVPLADHELRATRFALAAQARFDELARIWRKRGANLDLGIGLEAGHATVGRIGFEGRYDYGAIGPAVNLASRLSAHAAGGQILVGQRVEVSTKDGVIPGVVGKKPIAYEEEDERKRAPRRFRRVFHKLDSVGWTGDRRKHIFVVDVDGGEPRQLTSGDFEHDLPTWTADGRRILFEGLRDDNWDTTLINRLYAVDVDGGEPEALTGTDASHTAPSCSPDGSRIAFHATPEDGTYPYHSQIGVMNVDGSDRRLLTSSLDRQCAPYPETREPIWDGERIVFSVEDGGNIHLYAVPADGSAEPELLVGGEHVLGGYDARDGKVAYTASTHTTMRELYAGADGKRLTDVGRSFAEGRELARPERFTARSADGYEIDAWVVRPPGFEEGKRYPTLLTIHGGPFSQYGTGFFDEVQVYAGGGYVVLFSNPRGGSGYSEAHGRAIRGPMNGAGPGWGSVDYDDLMGVVDTALERFDFIDPDRLGVIGGSYGGYMTSWIIGHTNRFKAAISERAVNNLVSMFGSSDLFWVFHRQFGGPMWEDVNAYLEKSPSTYAQQIETPVLVLHSEQDLRCNIEQGEHFFNLLRLLGKEVEMVRFPSESHELSRSGSPIHRVTRFETILEYFGRYLSPGA